MTSAGVDGGGNHLWVMRYTQGLQIAHITDDGGSP